MIELYRFLLDSMGIAIGSILGGKDEHNLKLNKISCDKNES